MRELTQSLKRRMRRLAGAADDQPWLCVAGVIAGLARSFVVGVLRLPI